MFRNEVFYRILFGGFDGVFQAREVVFVDMVDVWPRISGLLYMPRSSVTVGGRAKTTEGVEESHE